MIHSSICMTPERLVKRSKSMDKLVWQLQSSDVPNLKLFDKVRMTKKKGIFENGYTGKWTEEYLQF